MEWKMYENGRISASTKGAWDKHWSCPHRVTYPQASVIAVFFFWSWHFCMLLSDVCLNFTCMERHQDFCSPSPSQASREIAVNAQTQSERDSHPSDGAFDRTSRSSLVDALWCQVHHPSSWILDGLAGYLVASVTSSKRWQHQAMDCAAPLWKLLPWKGFNEWLAGMIKKSAARLGSIFIIEPASTGSCEIETIGASVKFFKVLKPGQTCSKKKSQELLQNSASSCIHRAVLAPSLFRRRTKTPKDLEDRVLTKTPSAEFKQCQVSSWGPWLSGYLLETKPAMKSSWKSSVDSPIRYEMLKVPQQLPFLQQYSPTTKYLLAWHTSTDSAHYCVA